MGIILQLGMFATGNLGADFLRFLILLPVAIIIDLIIKAIKNRSKKKDDEISSEHSSKKNKNNQNNNRNDILDDGNLSRDETDDDDGLITG